MNCDTLTSRFVKSLRHVIYWQTIFNAEISVQQQPHFVDILVNSLEILTKFYQLIHNVLRAHTFTLVFELSFMFALDRKSHVSRLGLGLRFRFALGLGVCGCGWDCVSGCGWG